MSRLDAVDPAFRPTLKTGVWCMESLTGSLLDFSGRKSMRQISIRSNFEFGVKLWIRYEDTIQSIHRQLPLDS